MNLALIGNYGATNVGDEAILRSLLNLFASHQVTVFSADPKQTQKHFKVPCAPLFPLGIRSFFKFGFKSSIKALKKVDAAIIGGGGLFQDDKLYACFLWAWQIFWVKRFKKPLFICATGVGPLKTKWGKRLTLWAYRQAKMITVRDHDSRSTLIEMGFLESNIHLVADPTFLLEVPQGLKKLRKKQLFVSLRSWLSYTPQLLKEMEGFLSVLKQDQWEFTFVAMQSIKEEDQTLLKNLISKVGGKLFIPTDFRMLLEKMTEADAAVGMRYHFLIAALLTHTPFLSIAYSPKVSELTQNTALSPYLLSLTDFSSSSLFSAFERLLRHYSEILQDQENRLNQLRQLAQKNQELFMEFVKTIDPSQA